MYAGAAIGPYQIVRQLGAGGMGVVWLAEDTRLHRVDRRQLDVERHAGRRSHVAGRFKYEVRCHGYVEDPEVEYPEH